MREDICWPLRTEAWEAECNSQQRRGKESKEGMSGMYRSGWADDVERMRRLAACFRELVVAACAHGAVGFHLHHDLAQVARRWVPRGHRRRAPRLRHARRIRCAARLRLAAAAYLPSPARGRDPVRTVSSNLVFKSWLRSSTRCAHTETLSHHVKFHQHPWGGAQNTLHIFSDVPVGMWRMPCLALPL